MENKFSELMKENEQLKKENEQLKMNIDLLNEKYIDIQELNDSLNIKMEKLQEKIHVMNLDLQRISFRDLSKVIFNSMIDYINKKNKFLLKGLSKRKDKLYKINANFNFKDIEFMRMPFKEIVDRYYNSNSRSHVPEIVNYFKRQPYGLNPDPAGKILKKYYEIMIDSKQEEVLNFLSNTLNLNNEINTLYL